MIKRLLAFFAMLGLLLGMLSASANRAQADEAVVVNSDGLCLVTPEQVILIEHEAEYVEEARWSREVPAVEEESHVENTFYRDIDDVDAVTKKFFSFYRDIPAVEQTFDTWYRWKLVEPTEVTQYRYKKIIPGTEGVKECKYKKWIEGTDAVKEYRWEAIFKKGKELKGVQVTSSRVCSKGDANTWYEMPENVQPDRFDGIAPTGNVNLSVYCNSYQDGLTGSTSVAYKYGESYTVYHPGPGANSWTTNGSTPASPSGSSWGSRIERIKTPAVDGHWEYEWFTSNPGDGWTKIEDSCRWQVEPTQDTVKWFPSEDGWTTETKNSPWVLDDTRVIPGPDNVTWFPSEDGLTKEVKSEPWIKVAEESIGNDDAIPGYREFKTLGGASLLEDDISEFEESEFPGWNLLRERLEEIVEAIPGWREYLGSNNLPSRDILDAVWLKVNSVEGWNLLDTKKVVTTAAVEGYTEYYVPGGEPTRELGETNWTTDSPEGWEFVDSRERETAAAWTEEVTIPAVYEECDEPESLAYTGSSDMTGVYFGVGAFLVLLGSLLLWLRSRSNK